MKSFVSSAPAPSRRGGMDGDSIRTPDQRLRAFVSSTLGELAEEPPRYRWGTATSKPTKIGTRSSARQRSRDTRLSHLRQSVTGPRSAGTLRHSVRAATAVRRDVLHGKVSSPAPHRNVRVWVASCCSPTGRGISTVTATRTPARWLGALRLTHRGGGGSRPDNRDCGTAQAKPTLHPRGPLCDQTVVAVPRCVPARAGGA